MFYSSNKKQKTGAGIKFGSRFFLVLMLLSMGLAGSSCAIFATRPVQEMADTEAAIRAAREVQADSLAPELYREANEWFFKARHEYKFKNFEMAKSYAGRAQKFAEQAEFEALRNGGTRTDVTPADQGPGPGVSAGGGNGNPIGSDPQSTPSPTPYDYPSPAGTPADVYEQRKAADDAAKEQAKKDALSQSTPTPTSTESPILKMPSYVLPTLSH